MIYWIFFLFVSILFCSLSLSKSLDESIRFLFRLLLLITLVYFSAFRDELGQDYDGYLSKIEMSTDISIVEPLFSLIAQVIQKTFFSPILFFLIMAVLTNCLFVNSIYRYKYIFVILIVYLLHFAFYFNTFNIVRQMCAASIFLFSCRYIETQNVFKYVLCIIFAFTIHASAIILIPVYFFAKKEISSIVLFTVLFITLFFSSLFYQLFLLVNEILPFYDIYFQEDSVKVQSFGVFYYLYNIMVVVLIVYRDKVLIDDKSRIVFNMFFWGTVLLNLSKQNDMLYRLSVYFLIFVPISFSLIISIFKRNKLLQFVIVCFFLSVFFITLYDFNNDRNLSVIPSEMKSLFELID